MVDGCAWNADWRFRLKVANTIRVAVQNVNAKCAPTIPSVQLAYFIVCPFGVILGVLLLAALPAFGAMRGGSLRHAGPSAAQASYGASDAILGAGGGEARRPLIRAAEPPCRATL